MTLWTASLLLALASATVAETPRPPLLFLHGFCCGPEMWADQRSEVESDFDCWFPTLPHHGPDGVASASPTLEATSASLLELVRERWGDAPVVIGHSLGGMIALDMALRSPKSLEAVVLIDAFPSLERNKQVLPPLHGPSTPDSIQSRTRRVMQDQRKLMGEDVYQIFWNSIVEWDARAKLVAIQVPILAVYGGRGLFRSDQSQELGVALDFPPDMIKNLHVLEGAGHFVHLEQPESVNAVLRDFLETLCPSR